MQIVAFDKAIPWLKKNADSGDVEAAYLLGEIYCSESEYDKALPWLDKAIGDGYTKAETLKKTCKK